MPQFYKILTTCNQVDLLFYELEEGFLVKSETEMQKTFVKKVSSKKSKNLDITTQTQLSKLEIGQVVSVEVGSKQYLGVIWDGPFTKEEVQNSSMMVDNASGIKKIQEIHWFFLNFTQLELLDIFTKQTFNPAGAFLEAFLRPFFGLSKSRQKSIQQGFFGKLISFQSQKIENQRGFENSLSHDKNQPKIQASVENQSTKFSKNNLENNLENNSDSDFKTDIEKVSENSSKKNLENNNQKETQRQIQKENGTVQENFLEKNRKALAENSKNYQNLEFFIKLNPEDFLKKNLQQFISSKVEDFVNSQNFDSTDSDATDFEENDFDEINLKTSDLKTPDLTHSNSDSSGLKNYNPKSSNLESANSESSNLEVFKQGQKANWDCKSSQQTVNVLIAVPEKKYFEKLEKVFLEVQILFQKLINQDGFDDPDLKYSKKHSNLKNFILDLNFGFYSGDGNKQNQLAVNNVLSYLEYDRECYLQRLKSNSVQSFDDKKSDKNPSKTECDTSNHSLNHPSPEKKLTINLICATRSGIFLPFLDLEKIYLLEENSTFYIQEQNGLYFDTRDLLFLIHSKYQSKLTFISSLPSVRLYNFYQNHDINSHLEDLANFTSANFIISQRNYKNQLFGYKIEEVLSGLDNID